MEFASTMLGFLLHFCSSFSHSSSGLVGSILSAPFRPSCPRPSRGLEPATRGSLARKHCSSRTKRGPKCNTRLRLELQITLVCNSPKGHLSGQMAEESMGELEEEVALTWSSCITLVAS